jgi:hypothetical protein
MRLSARALALTSGILWGGCLLIVGLINLVAPSYGADFLRGMGSIYPGFYSSRTVLDVLLGTVYGFIDGAIGGWLFCALYNHFVGPKQRSDNVTQLGRAA